MGRVIVTDAIYEYLRPENSQLPGLSTMYKRAPIITSAGDFYNPFAAQLGAGAILYMHLLDQNEQRIEIEGMHNGTKIRQYECVLSLIYQSVIGNTWEVFEDAAQQAQYDNDVLIDALIAYIEAERQLNNPNVIFSAGEGMGVEAWGPDLRVQSNLPREINEQLTQIWSTITMYVIEFINT